MCTKEQTGRLIVVAHKIWKIFTEDERANFYADTGTFGFVMTVADMLNIDISDLTISQFEAVHDMIIRTKGGKNNG